MRSFEPYKQWIVLLKDKKFRVSLFFGIVLMIIALNINFIASRYVSNYPKAVPVQDLILDHIPTINLNFLYVTGIFIIISTIILYPLLFKPEIAPFSLKTYSFFIMIRSFFISLTHIAAPENYYLFAGPSEGTPVIASFFTLNDLFFSAHTGIPFLAFLLFYKNKILRYFFLIGSFAMALTVLFMHVHYSIDVFAAYFITYSIYKVSDSVFNKLNKKFSLLIHNIYHKQEGKIRRFIKKEMDILKNINK